MLSDNTRFIIDYNYNDIDKKILKQKLQDVLHNTIKDLPFGNNISDEYKRALEITIYHIMYYNRDNKIATIPMATGGGKTTALINAVSYMVNDPILHEYAGTIILRLRQEDCDETTASINQKAGKEVAYSYHSGLGVNKRPKSQISKRKLSQYPVIVMCHEGFKELIKKDTYNKILNCTDAKVSEKYGNFNKWARRRLIIDEEISNVEIQTITLKTITLIENSIMNMGNRYLYKAFSNFIKQAKEVFIKPYEIKANFSKFINLEIKIPEKLDEYIYNETNRATQEAYLTLRNFLRHGGYIQYSKDINKKVITTYSYINLNSPPILYKVQLDATASINYLYDINKDFYIVQLPEFKTYSNTYIHVFDKITGSRSMLEQGFDNGLLDSCIKDIKDKAQPNDKILIILNNRQYIDKFKELFYDFKPYQGCKPQPTDNIKVEFTYYGAFAGKNEWSMYNKLFMIGIPIYSETTYPLLYHVNSGNKSLDNFDTTLVPMDGARRYLQEEFEKVRISIVARELIQGINRIRCRWFKEGDTPEAHIYIINKDKEVDKIIKQAMPKVKILYDWDLDYEHVYKEVEEKPLSKEQQLINTIMKIQDNLVYRQYLIAKGMLDKNKGIKKKDLRKLCEFKSRQTFSNIINSPIFAQFSKDRNIDISNSRSHYLKI